MNFIKTVSSKSMPLGPYTCNLYLNYTYMVSMGVWIYDTPNLNLVRW